ncbi:alkyl hydroperoxide reductase/ Thiol specific antioxidant/ Mal allergen [Kangiella koreensis DSM 16069]|uniref:Alkyl hydroperoxide reductase/ Thiol specific antioxidant/ Mal allergen n=1 Tax=Kangiella koreensis (strain DSM 16069 / JCM 12317 / KCTC 12182 / SW-125) TaxID=523791 RepID=C7RCQ3_KANKD|nr:alkyl hydroperoxide reductase/ Thiol specific antioxidant/ Mal allergen [Kangiella koreensis DSM 16069]
MIIMRHLCLRFILSAFLLLLVVSCDTSKEFSLLSGEQKNLSDYEGSWLVVNFWAEWCPPCLEEIPELNLLAQENGNIQVLGVSFDRLPNEELIALTDKLDIQYPVVATEPMPFLPMERPQSLPASYIVTPKGEVMGPLLGKVDRHKIIELIEKIKTAQ